MATTLAELILLGLLVDWLFRKVKLPGLLGILLLGVVMGPHALNLMAPNLLSISGDIRQIALIIILLRAGLELSKESLKKVGKQAALLAFIPCVMEGFTIALIAPKLFPLTFIEAGMLGFIVAAVSPAVVIPFMIHFLETKRGEKKGIPTLILASASIDDVVSIVIFSVFLGFFTGTETNVALKLASVPASILTGIIAGCAVGWALYAFYKKTNPRATKRAMILIGVSILLIRVEHLIAPFPFAALLAVMSAGFIILEKQNDMANEISQKLAKLWVFASILLFALVGAEVDVPVMLNSGLLGLVLIFSGLIARSIGVQLCLIGSDLTMPERNFVMIASWPKATVQAAMGSVPLITMQQMGVDTANGNLILAICVLSIIVTAPLGAIAIHHAGDRILSRD